MDLQGHVLELYEVKPLPNLTKPPFPYIVKIRERDMIKPSINIYQINFKYHSPRREVRRYLVFGLFPLEEEEDWLEYSSMRLEA